MLVHQRDRTLFSIMYVIALGLVFIGMQCSKNPTSPDISPWTIESSGTTVDLQGITYANGQFVAVGDNVVLTSSDGVTWTKGYSGAATSGIYLFAVCYGNGKFVASGQIGWYPSQISAVLTSIDASTWTIAWTKQISGAILGLNSVTYGNGKFVAVGDYGTIVTSLTEPYGTIRRRLG